MPVLYPIVHTETCHQHTLIYSQFDTLPEPFPNSSPHYSQCHIRLVKSAPSNWLSFGARPKKRQNFTPAVNRIFSNLVLDPSDFENTQSNLCVPLSIALSLITNFQKTTPTEITRAQITNTLNAIHFRHLLDPIVGIPMHQFKDLEKGNTPPSPAMLNLFEGLDKFSGIGINLFTVRLFNDGTTTKVFLLPSILSTKHNDPTVYQMDLIKDSSCIRSPGHKITQNHVLIATNLPLLLARRNTKTRKNAHKYTHSCRACCRAFLNEVSFVSHSKTCEGFSTKGKCKPRRAKNIKIHQPFRINKFNLREERNGLTFRRGHAYKTIMPLHSTFIDTEATTRAIPANVQNQPPNAIAHQNILGYCLVHTSNYPEHKLPSSLLHPRSVLFDSIRQTDHSLYIHLLTTIRNDMSLLSDHLKSALESDPGRQSLSSMSVEDLTNYLSTTACNMCGRKFGTYYRLTTLLTVFVSAHQKQVTN